MTEANRCIIDNTDISTLGMFIERGGSNDFLSFPHRRTPDFNDWAEYDGLDVDLSDLSFEAKKVTVKYLLIATDETAFKHCLSSFENLHRKDGYINMYVAEYSKTFDLRFVAFSHFEQKGGFTTARKKIAHIWVDYIMDNPLQVYTTAIDVPVSARTHLAHISINSYDLSRFGIVVREVYSTAIIPRSAKKMLEMKSNSLNGIIADTSRAKKHPRQIEIKCTMLAESVTELMINLSALWANMNSTSPVKLRIRGEIEGMQCYYVKMSGFVKESAFRRKVKVSFSLHLQEFSEIQLIRLLASQDERLIETQDGRLIDLNY